MHAFLSLDPWQMEGDLVDCTAAPMSHDREKMRHKVISK